MAQEQRYYTVQMGTPPPQRYKLYAGSMPVKVYDKMGEVQYERGARWVRGQINGTISLSWNSSTKQLTATVSNLSDYAKKLQSRGKLGIVISRRVLRHKAIRNAHTRDIGSTVRSREHMRWGMATNLIKTLTGTSATFSSTEFGIPDQIINHLDYMHLIGSAGTNSSIKGYFIARVILCKIPPSGTRSYRALKTSCTPMVCYLGWNSSNAIIVDSVTVDANWRRNVNYPANKVESTW